MTTPDPRQPTTCHHPLEQPDPGCPVCEMFDDVVLEIREHEGVDGEHDELDCPLCREDLEDGYVRPGDLLRLHDEQRDDEDGPAC